MLAGGDLELVELADEASEDLAREIGEERYSPERRDDRVHRQSRGRYARRPGRSVKTRPGRRAGLGTGREARVSSLDVEPFDLVISACRLAPDGRRADVGIRAGTVAALGDLAGAAARHRVDADGRFVVPGFVDAHVHLDKAYLLPRTPSREGTLAEAIRVTADAKRAFTVDDIRARARAAPRPRGGHGHDGHARPRRGRSDRGAPGLEAVLPLRREYADRLDLQLCAFAQEGIVQAPGTEALLRDALRAGADLVGGCPYNDTDGARTWTGCSPSRGSSTATRTFTPTSPTSRCTATWR